MIYLDNAATSWPKPEAVLEAMTAFMRDIGANPGRSGHRLSVEAGRTVLDAREAVAELLSIRDPMRVVFGLNATDALNLAIRGTLRPGDHVVTGSMEHNSVMRPLRDLEAEGVELTVVQASPEGFMDPVDVSEAMRPGTRLVAMIHASNVVGSLLSIRDIGAIARDAGALFLVDAAQTAGCCPIDVGRDNVDLLAFTGHKGLLGPQGTGGLAFGPDVDVSRVRPLRSGGTGSRSEHEVQPDFLPDRYESGTMNGVGLAGLAAGVRYVLERGVDDIRGHEVGLVRRFIDGVRGIEGIDLYGGGDARRQTATLSINLRGEAPSDVGLALDEDHDILCRVGLHCAPAAHRTIGTFPDGTVRLSFGAFNSRGAVDAALDALRGMVGR
ncbi:MAG: aminotransferase class V-fold PLP-dependent enzyme [Thermoplasmata archaeon]|nr:aminotransferase class V-fold PLP-dependent enzyme [Thermoplasmata archaeon]